MFRPTDPQVCLVAGIALGALALVLVYLQFRKGWQQTVGLPLGYICVFIIAHIGSMIYLLPWYDPSESAYLKQAKVSLESVSLGTWLAGWSAFSFSLGTMLIANSPQTYARRTGSAQGSSGGTQESKVVNNASSESLQDHLAEAATTYLIPNKLIVVGLLFLVLGPILGRIPSFSPIASSAKFFVVSGFCLGYFLAVHYKSATFQLYYYTAILVLPVATVILFGFLAAGANMLAICMAFYVNRPASLKGHSSIGNWLMRAPIYFVFGWLGLSAFVTYMNGRESIRRVVWEDSTLLQKANIAWEEMSKFEFFDIYNSEHLQFLDGRLNQSELIGKAIQFHEADFIEFEMGKTLVYATVAWIPRILWPDKPVSGGSEFVSLHTGRKFSTTTTIASGQVFELYVNFGMLGPIVGLFLLGYILRYIDIRASQQLLSLRVGSFVKWHIVGLAFIQPSAQIFFIVTSVAGAVILVSVTSSWLARRTML